MISFSDFKKITNMIDEAGKLKLFPLFTKQELATRWGVNRQMVNNWAARHTDFCKPVEGIVRGAGSYYPFYEVERYEKTRGLNVDE